MTRTPESALTAAHLIRQRRSAVSFDRTVPLTLAQFLAILDKTLPRNQQAPFDLELGPPRVHLALFVHNVLGLEQGLYAFVRNASDLQDLKRTWGRDLAWEPAHDSLPFYLLKAGDYRSSAAHISCHQLIAGQSAFSLGMISRFNTLLDKDPWLYKHLFWECGMIGQALYLEAEAQGVRGTGIGCFFDDAMHEVLGIKTNAYQSLYHFTIGGPLEDIRLTTEPAYVHFPVDRRRSS